jgi:hypothetical protein
MRQATIKQIVDILRNVRSYLLLFLCFVLVVSI